MLPSFSVRQGSVEKKTQEYCVRKLGEMGNYTHRGKCLIYENVIITCFGNHLSSRQTYWLGNVALHIRCNFSPMYFFTFCFI